MKISLLTVGKIKEKFYTQAIDEFSKRLGRYCKLEIIEVADEKTPDNASAAVDAQIRQKEGNPRRLQRRRVDIVNTVIHPVGYQGKRQTVHLICSASKP